MGIVLTGKRTMGTVSVTAVSTARRTMSSRVSNLYTLVKVWSNSASTLSVCQSVWEKNTFEGKEITRTHSSSPHLTITDVKPFDWVMASSHDQYVGVHVRLWVKNIP